VVGDAAVNDVGPATHDRRQQLCSLTAAGRRAVDAAIPPVAETQARIISGLSEGEARALVALLRRVAP
jgi:DNA-binding MarR family transcriptional regulator